MALLHLEALPRDTNKGTLVRLLIQVGGIGKDKIGKIELTGRGAMIDVPDSWGDRLVRLLDGATLGTSHIRARLGAAEREEPAAKAASPARGGEVGAKDHFARLTRLLELESDAEAAQILERARKFRGAEAERTGSSLVGMLLRDAWAGLGGRVIVRLTKRDQKKPLPFNRIEPGTPVLLSLEEGEGSWRGVVSDRSSSALEIALARMPETESDTALFRIDVANDEVARERQKAAMQRIAAASAATDRVVQLRDVLLGQRAAKFEPGRGRESFSSTSKEVGESAREKDSRPRSLNASQAAAIDHALAAKDVAIIHGPPGTGKTTTVVELMRQAVGLGQTILATAPSNTAVDNMLERLLAVGVNAVRLGHPARVLPQLREHTLDLIVDNHPDVALAHKLIKEAYQLRAKAQKYTRTKPPPGAKQALWAESKELIADARRIESQVVEQVLDGAEVLCATLTGIDSELLGKRHFDLAVIDEACQCTEPACWIPVLRADKLVLAGDHWQLPPTVVSAEAKQEGFGVSMLERLMHSHAELARQLTVQYRMHEEIMLFSSAEFYDSTLVADPSVAAHRLADLPGVEPSELTERAIQFIDTAGAGFDEELEPDGESRRNPQEAKLVAKLVDRLRTAGLAWEQIAVIAPYSAQVRMLRAELLAPPGLEIDSVDGFQGREKEAVVISLVRSNATGEIGFLADVRRMNVALTRARRKLIVVGDSATVGGNSFYRRLIDYFEGLGAYQSVWEFL